MNRTRRSFIKQGGGVCATTVLGFQLGDSAQADDTSGSADIQHESSAPGAVTVVNGDPFKINIASFDVDVKNHGTAAGTAVIKLEIIDNGPTPGQIRKTITKTTPAVAAGATHTQTMIAQGLVVTLQAFGQFHFCDYKLYIDGVLVDSGSLYNDTGGNDPGS